MADTDREEWHVKVNVQEAASVLGCGKLMMCIVVSIPPILSCLNSFWKRPKMETVLMALKRIGARRRERYTE